MQKSELKTHPPKNSLKHGDLNIIMKFNTQEKNIKKSNILYHLVTCKSSKLYSTVTNSDSEFFTKKHKNRSILSHFVNQNHLKHNRDNNYRLFAQELNTQKPFQQCIITLQKEHFLSKNETLFSKKIQTSPELNEI
jgi:hypothetical protein